MPGSFENGSSASTSSIDRMFPGHAVPIATGHNGVRRASSAGANIAGKYLVSDAKQLRNGVTPKYQPCDASRKAVDPRIRELYADQIRKSPKRHCPSIKTLTYVFDKNSVGTRPTQVLLSNLSTLTTKSQITKEIRLAGRVKECRLLTDDKSGAFLGLCLVRFDGDVPVAYAAAKKLLKLAPRTRIDGQKIVAEFDETGDKATAKKKEIVRSAIRKQQKQEKLAKKRNRSKSPRGNERNRSRSPSKSLHEREKDIERYTRQYPCVVISVPDDLIKLNEVIMAIKNKPGKYAFRRVVQKDSETVLVVFNFEPDLVACLSSFKAKFGAYKIQLLNCKAEITQKRSDTLKEVPISDEELRTQAIDELLRELRSSLWKDIKERTVGPAIHEFLNKQGHVIEEQRKKEKKEVTVEPSSVPTTEQQIDFAKINKFNSRILKGSKISKRLTKRLKPLKAFKPVDDESDEITDHSRVGSRTPEPRHAQKHDVDFTSSSEEEEEVEEGEEQDELMEEQPLVEEEEEVAEKDIEMAEAADLDKVSELSYGPRAGARPTPIVSDPPGPYNLAQFIDLIKDEEDFRFFKESLRDFSPAFVGNLEYWAWKQLQPSTKPPAAEPAIQSLLPENARSSFKAAQYKKILESDKSSYLVHKREARTLAVLDSHTPEPTAQTATTSRGNRVNARREEKQISINNDIDTDILSINKLKKRKKPVEFRRSAIHDWGLYAMESIPRGEMIIEYVGEVIRSSLQDIRERNYTKSGIGSSYLFHVDRHTVIDATKQGGIARFINHSCTPSCIAKIIQVQGTSRIVIYAARDIAKGEELTYDYKFEREEGEDRVPCLCGSEKCKGWLN
ncbi:hypothetical protein TRVA0_018S00804 [Trichomonascus vanleenenianus]|uniref:histone methyltransferase SET1 n=1 Tax=Trichomonascus vanleenenianus TaxID=2268995 RepID=UPI003EC95B94